MIDGSALFIVVKTGAKDIGIIILAEMWDRFAIGSRNACIGH